METNLLKIFTTYAQTQNLRMTAQLHNTSHVAVIRAIKSLEDLTGAKLSMRVGRGSALTEDGKKLVTLAKNVLREEKSLLALKRKTESSPKEFKIATFEVFSTHLAPHINQALELDTQVTWSEKTPGAIEKAVRLGEANLGITYLPVPAPEVEHLKVGSVQMAVYQGAKPRYTKSELDQVPFVVPAQPDYDTPSKAKGLDGWPDHKRGRKIHYRVTLLETALAMTAAGQCVGYFPKFVADLRNESSKNNKLVEFSQQPKAAKQEVFIVKRVDEEESPSIKKVSKILRNLS